MDTALVISHACGKILNDSPLSAGKSFSTSSASPNAMNLLFKSTVVSYLWPLPRLFPLPRMPFLLLTFW